MKTRFVVITTDSSRRGVFGGNFISQDGDTVTLKNAKMCVYWSIATKGVLGLAATGPKKGSKLTPKIPKLEVNGVTAVMDCTKEAIEQWGKEMWG